MKITAYIIVGLICISSVSCNKEKIENEQILLEEFLEKYGYTDEEPTESGLYCIETGFSTPLTLTAKYPVKGNTISTVYKGWLLEELLADKEVYTTFDERDFENPGEYVYLTDQVIPGWEEAMGLLKTDMSAILIIPSDLAYKNKQVGVIPPYSTLVYEVRVLDIK